MSLCSGGSGVALMKKKEAVGKTHCLVTLKKQRKGVVIEWVVATPGWLSSFGVRGGAGWLSSVGVRGEAKRMGRGHIRQGLVAVLVTWALWGGC